MNDNTSTTNRNAPSSDVEKQHGLISAENGSSPSPPIEDAQQQSSPPDGRVKGLLKTFERTLLRYNIEARGVQRVLPEDRHDLSRLGFTQIMLLWISINLEAVVIALGFLGPIVYYLPFMDSCLLGVFGSIVGATPVAYIATFGPRSGNRTMILTRFITGWYPSKLIVVLTLIIFMGYILIDAVVGGQILSAVADGRLSVIVGIVIVCAITWVVSTFGYILSILSGVAGQNFDLYGNPSAGLSSNVIAGNRLSFFSLCLAAQITYAQGAADFFVYYPVNASRTKVFISTLAGLTLSSTFALVVGIGLGSGTFTNPDWAAAYEVSQGALIVEAFKPLGSFGSFCSVIVALSLIGNMVAPTYASGIDFQALGHMWENVPRIFWNTLALVIPMICAITGRGHLAEIFTNFLALMGYWVSIWIAIFLEEHLIFRKWLGRGWKWEDWNDRTRLPLGVAALIAFIVGWVGSILCMAQVWYVGPLAALISEYGGDMGNYVGFAWAGLVYPPLRWLELKKFGR
ncbi:Putative purine-cytosine permease, vitamin B6 transporter Tpn1 [Septoria linicola]|uniref:Purine-cytosine permease, vitamin B6 transporter Tpn1 n=1 Tax=Septoria linicola TaxID=215465 RepID=A0A9Q9EGH1_9PEZI|nr:putative purine-cytosine permease [Septoria linicola]USW48914.1 Putative purine-cytosine permease, vitamin B6 transporter Tpn1 [Septoria linicola]